MCGICCVVQVKAANGAKGVEHSSAGSHIGLEAELNASLDYIKHRGPDSAGVWISDDHQVGTVHSLHLNSTVVRALTNIVQHSATAA